MGVIQEYREYVVLAETAKEEAERAAMEASASEAEYLVLQEQATKLGTEEAISAAESAKRRALTAKMESIDAHKHANWAEQVARSQRRQEIKRKS